LPADRFEAFIDAEVQGGRYNNASEVVRDALRLLEDQEKLRELRLAELRRLSEAGRASGLSAGDGESVLDRLEHKYRAMLRTDEGSLRFRFSRQAEPARAPTPTCYPNASAAPPKSFATPTRPTPPNSSRHPARPRPDR
jgi:antitoxin ParD1/3/4